MRMLSTFICNYSHWFNRSVKGRCFILEIKAEAAMYHEDPEQY